MLFQESANSFSDKCTLWNIFGPCLCVFVANLKIDAIYVFYQESFCYEKLSGKFLFFSDSVRVSI